jgi:DNA-binding MarR family transcriptional regulator/N-acetylglutamate synthase-like GNAT family acetyltransferase
MSTVETVRGFNRFYTKQIGLLSSHYLHSGLSLTQVRVLYEVAHRTSPTASELTKELGLDPGYLSRILKGFASRGLIRRERSREDGREQHLSMTRSGHAAFAPLEDTARAEIQSMLSPLSERDQKQLVAAMHSIETLLGPPREPAAPYILRPHQPGDMGWVIQRHSVLYTQEYGWDQTFEALVAEIAAKFIRNFDPKYERCWIAERDGEKLGCVFLVRKSAAVSKLRMLLVEPSARGLGLGNRLVDECIQFGRQAGYRKMVLWTQSVLTAARHIYAKAGFKIVASRKNRMFHHNLVSETWELDLR